MNEGIKADQRIYKKVNDIISEACEEMCNETNLFSPFNTKKVES